MKNYYIIFFLFCYSLNSFSETTYFNPFRTFLAIDETTKKPLGSAINLCLSFHQDELYFLTANHVAQTSNQIAMTNDLVILNKITKYKSWPALDLALLKSPPSMAVLFSPCLNLSTQLQVPYITDLNLLSETPKVALEVEAFSQKSEKLIGVKLTAPIGITTISRKGYSKIPLLVLPFEAEAGMSGGLIRAEVSPKGEISPKAKSQNSIGNGFYRSQIIGIIVARSKDEKLIYAIPSTYLLKMTFENNTNSVSDPDIPDDDTDDSSGPIDSGTGRPVEKSAPPYVYQYDRDKIKLNSSSVTNEIKNNPQHLEIKTKLEKDPSLLIPSIK